MIALVIVIVFATHNILRGCSSSVFNLKRLEPHPAPVLEFSDRSGKRFNLGDFKGKPVIVHFWATWCKPCIEELPRLDNIQEIYGEKGLIVLAISLDNRPMEKVTQFLSTQRITHLTPYLDNGNAMKAAAIRGLPTTIFLSRENMQIARVLGVLHWNSQDAHDFIKELIDMNPPAANR